MNDCKRLEILLEKFAAESDNVNRRLGVQKTKISDLKSDLAQMLRTIEAF